MLIFYSRRIASNGRKVVYRGKYVFSWHVRQKASATLVYIIVTINVDQFLPARRYASAVFAAATCPSVCPSVRHTSVLCENDAFYTQSYYGTLIGNNRQAIDRQASYTAYNPTTLT